MNDPFSAIATLLAAIIALIGAYVGVSLRRQLKNQVSERRLTAYAALWQAMEKAAPSRQKPLTESERSELFDKLTSWYYSNGFGMCLTSGCRNVFLKAKGNLVARTSDLQPTLRKYVLHADNKEQERRSKLAISQLSLLRTRMRADLDIFGRWYQDEDLSDEARAFLEDCGEDFSEYPWRRPPQRHRILSRPQ
jgi:hypothetical protein